MKKNYLPESFIAYVEQHHDKGGDKVRKALYISNGTCSCHVNQPIFFYYSERVNLLLESMVLLLPNEPVHLNSFSFAHIQTLYTFQ